MIKFIFSINKKEIRKVWKTVVIECYKLVREWCLWNKDWREYRLIINISVLRSDFQFISKLELISTRITNP